MQSPVYILVGNDGEVLILPTLKASTLKHNLKQFVRKLLMTGDTV